MRGERKTIENRQAPRVFVQESYDKSDAWGQSVVKEWLVSRGFVIKWKEAEDYGLDIIAVKDGVPEYFEVEVKTNYSWTGKEDFRFDSVSFLGRKKKWADIGYWYVIVCRETRAMVMCHSDKIFKSEYREVIDINSYERKGKDTLYRVPKDECYWINP